MTLRDLYAAAPVASGVDWVAPDAGGVLDTPGAPVAFTSVSRGANPKSSRNPTRPVRVSFELYPPRNPDPFSQAWAGIDRLLDAHPDYVSVTFGTSNSTSASSQSVLAHALQRLGRPVLAHLTCVGKTRTELSTTITEMLDIGVRDFLALRGDNPKGSVNWEPAPGEFSRASQLVTLLREVAAEYLGDARAISIAVAAYPAGTVSARTNAVAALAEKQSAGADFAITQVFYNADDYGALLDSATYQGVSIPIIPGIIPFTDAARLQRLEGLTGVSVPSRLQAISEISDPEERFLEGLSATLDFVNDLIQAGAPGLHFYTFNRPRPVLDLVEHLRSRGFTHVDEDSSSQLLDLMNAAMQRFSP